MSQGRQSQRPPSGRILEESALAFNSSMADSPEMESPLSGERNDLAAPAQAVVSSFMASRWGPVDLPQNVLNAPSMRCLYTLKWSVFSTWCTPCGEDSSTCDISLILSFLQELLDKGHTPSTFKVYVVAIPASHAPIAGQSVGYNNLAFHLKWPVPTWALSTKRS